MFCGVFFDIIPDIQLEPTLGGFVFFRPTMTQAKRKNEAV